MEKNKTKTEKKKETLQIHFLSPYSPFKQIAVSFKSISFLKRKDKLY